MGKVIKKYSVLLLLTLMGLPLWALGASGAIPFLLIILTVIYFFYKNGRKEEIIKEQNLRLLEMGEEYLHMQQHLIATLGEVVEKRSQITGEHARRVSLISKCLAEKVDLTREEIIAIKTTSPLHDIGKIGISDAILLKDGPLTKEEFDTIKTHTEMGRDILSACGHPLMQTAADIAYCHHERWDGNGYPRGLEGEEIPLSARITTVADVYDALLTDRSYKRAWSHHMVISYMEKEAGSRFDPYLVEILTSCTEEIRNLCDTYSCPATMEEPARLVREMTTA